MLVPKHTMEVSMGWKRRETLAVLRVASDHPWTLPLPVLEKMVGPVIPVLDCKVGFPRNSSNIATLGKLLGHQGESWDSVRGTDRVQQDNASFLSYTGML